MSDRHLRRPGNDYRDAFLQLLPQGPAWPKHAFESVLWRVVEGLCNYWGYVDSRAGDLLEIESDPRLTMELLQDWERNFGLPDPCLKNPPTSLDGRHAALVAWMTQIGGQSRDFYIGMAAAYGYKVKIREYAPYMTGVSHVGDTRGVYDHVDTIHYRWVLGPPEIRFYWTVSITDPKLTYFHCASSQCGVDRLLDIYILTDLECVLDKLKPAQTDIVYDYSGVDTSVLARRLSKRPGPPSLAATHPATLATDQGESIREIQSAI